MVIGVVGANGFIGRHLCKILPHAIPITRESIQRIKKCEIIFNVAGKSIGSLNRMMEDNFYLPKTILEETNATYIHAGSSVEYGNYYNAPDEDTPLNPNTEYGVTKASASALVAYYGSKGRKCCNLRLYCIYGEGDRKDSLLSNVVKFGKNGKFPPLSHPYLSRDFVHVSDVCEAFLLAAKNLHPDNYGEAFNIGTGLATTLAQIAKIAKEAFRIKNDPIFNNLPYESWYSDPSKARDLLGFNPKMELSTWIKKQAKNGQ